MITEALGINYYVIGPSLCLLMTGVLFIISDLSLNLKTRYLGIVLTTGIFFTGVTIYLKIGEFARIGLSSHFSSMILLDEFALLGDVLLYFIAICTIPTIWTSSSVLGEKRTEAVVLVLMSLSGFMLMTSSEHYIMKLGLLAYMLLLASTEKTPTATRQHLNISYLDLLLQQFWSMVWHLCILRFPHQVFTRLLFQLRILGNPMSL